MPPDFLLRAGAAGIGVALAAGPLGCFVLWRRMAFFGDATAHAAILGVALALALSLPVSGGVLAAALAMGFGMTLLSGRGLASDALLGVLAHGALAAGLVAVALTRPRGVDIESFLFGEILAVGTTDLALIWVGAGLVLALLAWRWRPLLTATLSPDLAAADEIDPRREHLVLTLAIAVVVAVGLKVVGALLVSAMLIIPAASARQLSRTPEGMAGLAALGGIVSATGGLWLSWHLDTPAGPTIVTAATGLFALCQLAGILAPRNS